MVWLSSRPIHHLQDGPIPSSYKWVYKFYKWPQKNTWGTGVIVIMGPFKITCRGPPCSHPLHNPQSSLGANFRTHHLTSLGMSRHAFYAHSHNSLSKGWKKTNQTIPQENPKIIWPWKSTSHWLIGWLVSFGCLGYLGLDGWFSWLFGTES